MSNIPHIGSTSGLGGLGANYITGVDAPTQSPVANNKDDASSDAHIYATFDLLPHLKEILTQIETAPHDRNATLAVTNLITRIDACRTLLNSLPGVDISHDEQMEQYQILTRAVQRKTEIAEQYRLLASSLAPSSSPIASHHTTPAPPTTTDPNPMSMLVDEHHLRELMESEG